MSEIVKFVISFCIVVLFFPFIIKISNFLGECVYDAAKIIIADYKEQWKWCIKLIERWIKND